MKITLKEKEYKIMKIAISGSQHSGKTTLIQALKSLDEFKHFNFFKSASRHVNDTGGKVNRSIDKKSQIRIFEQHYNNILKHNSNKDVLFDRCILDALSYATDSCGHGHIKPSVVETGVQYFEKLMPLYDYVFYLEPIADMSEDGVRDTNEQYRKDVVEIYKDIIEDTKFKNVFIIDGTIKERTHKIKEIVYG